MSTTWKEQARERFSASIAAGKWHAMYEAATESLEEENFRLRREFTVDLITRRFEPDAVIVDAGCGAGPVLAGLWERGYRATGLDCSPDMLDFARQRLRGMGADPAAVSEGDVTALPFADGSVDCVVCLGVISYVPEPQRALEEIRRVLRPGGLALVSFRNRFNPILSDPVALAKYLVNSARGRDRRVRRTIGQFLDPREVRRAVDAAGLTLDRVEGIGLGPFRFARRNLFAERHSISVSRGLSGALHRLGLSAPARWMSDVHVCVCTRP